MPAASAKVAAGIKKRLAEHSVFKASWMWLDSHELSRVCFMTYHAILGELVFLYPKQGAEEVRIVHNGVIGASCDEGLVGWLKRKNVSA